MNHIPDILKERGLTVRDLTILIIRNGDSITQQALSPIAGEKAAGLPLPKGVRAGTLIMIAKALDVSLDDLVELEPV